MKQKQETVKAWFGSGSPWVWMNAGAVSIAVIMTIGLLAVIAVRGLGHFWPANVIEATYQIPGEAAKTVIGEVVQAEEVPRARLRSAGMPVPEAGPEFMTRELLKLGNRELYGSDFSWVVGEWLQDIKRPEALMVLERREWGNFYGYLLSVKENGQVVAEGDAAVGELQKRMQRVDDLYAKLYKLEKGDIGGINHGLERLRLKERKLQLDGKLDAAAQADLAAERSELQARYKVLEEQLNGLHQEFNRDSVVMRDASGRESEITLGKLVHAYQPNAMGLGTKMTVYFKKLWEFLSDDPREANTEGGIFPAIFGTVMMTLVMALIVTPFGVIAAVYLREYAKQGPLTRVIRIAVNNLAGTGDRLRRVRPGFLRLRAGRFHRPAVLPRGPAGADLRYPRTVLGLADPGDPRRAGGDRRHRGRPGADSARGPRRLPGARRDQGGNAVEDRPADGQPGDDDRPDPRRGSCRRRSGAADAGRRGETGTVAAGRR